MTETTYRRPINYFEGDRIRITWDESGSLNKSWVGRTGTVVLGTRRAFNEGVNVKLDRPVGEFDTVWLRHSEVEFEDNRTERTNWLQRGDYVHADQEDGLSRCNADFQHITYADRWFRYVGTDRYAAPESNAEVPVKCLANCFSLTLYTTYDRYAFMCDQPSLPVGE